VNVIQYGDKKSFNKFVNLCVNEMKVEIESGAATTASYSLNNEHPFGMDKVSDSRFHWFQSILLQICLRNGPCVLDTLPKLQETLALVWEKCSSKRAAKWNAKTVRNILLSLTELYFVDSLPVPSDKWNSKGKFLFPFCFL
jgi:hypothetical protein